MTNSCVCDHSESAHETYEYRGDKARRCFADGCSCGAFKVAPTGDLAARLQEIHERLEKASKGVWEKRPGDVQDVDRGLPRPLVRQSDGQPIHAVAVRRGNTGWDWVTTACETNVDFIANAKQDIPFLLDQLAEAQATITALQRSRIADSEIIGREMCRAEKAEVRLSELEAWKAEALQSLDNWFALGDALMGRYPLQVGDNIPEKLLERIKNS